MAEAHSILPILKKIPLFAELTEQSHEEIIKRIELQLYPAGYILFHEGDAGDTLYIIKSGLIKVSRKDPVTGSDREVAALGPNDFFGEMALITSGPRNATVTVIEETEVFVLRKSDFLKLMADVPDMANKISIGFIDRVKMNNKNNI